MRSDDVVLAVLPFFHVFGLSSVVNVFIRHGGCLSIVPRFQPGAVLDAIEAVQPAGRPEGAVHRQAAVGRADARLRPGGPVLAAGEEIIAYRRERVAAYKYPREIRFMAEPPKGPSGKILKNALRDG